MLPLLRISTALGRYDNSIASKVCGTSYRLLPDYQQYRGRKRALKKTLSRQEKLARRIKREEKEAARKQFSFMERIKIRRMKKMQSPSEMGPGRFDETKENELPDRPFSNIYFREDIKHQFLSIADGLAIHRLQQKPEIYNNVKAPVKLRIELNMTTERATKMIAASDEILPVPYPFSHNEKRSILAFAADLKNQDLAVEAGAEIAVGVDMVKKIIKGQFRVDDYDFCVAHSNMAGPVLAPLRGLLRSKFPSKNNGAMGDDMAELVDKFKKGVKVSIRPDAVYPMWGLCEPVVGNLALPDQQLEDNIQAVIEAVCAHRSPALGPFINRCLLTIIPTHTFVPIDVSKFMPVATAEEIEKFENRKKKKSKTVKHDDDSEVKEQDPLLALM